MSDFVIKVEGAQPYSFEDERSGRRVEGVNIFHMVEAEGEAVGRIPSKITLPYETWNLIRGYPFPCDCELVTKQTFGRKGLVTKVTGLKLAKAHQIK